MSSAKHSSGKFHCCEPRKRCVRSTRAGGAMADGPEPFDMRRIETLSNTIFGVAMTMLAYDFPKERLGAASPTWSNISVIYGSHLLALVLSFIVAGIFWLSHQRRLTYASKGGRPVVIMNLLFLLAIVGLPVTTGLFGSYPEARDVVTIYGLHLVLLSALNTVLWWMAAASGRDWHMVAGPALSTAIFVVAALAAIVEPYATRFVWPLAFITPFVGSFAERKARRGS